MELIIIGINIQYITRGGSKMKKWLSIIILTLIVTACGKAETTSEQTEEKPESETKEETSTTEPNTEEDTNSTEDNDETTETDENKEEGKDQEKSEEADTPKEPKYELTGNWDLKPIGDANEKVVLLTIDDAPDKYGLEMAKTLKELNAPAIFFVNGHFMDTDEEKEIVKQIHEMGFAIGNHTVGHKALKKGGNPIAQEAQKEQIIPLSDQIEEITGERPVFFRAPHGLNTDYSNQLAEQEGMLVMNWTYGYDWNKEYMTEEAIADIMVNTPLLHNGANLLMHDREWTAKALDDIVKGLREKGYELIDPNEIKTP